MAHDGASGIDRSRWQWRNRRRGRDRRRGGRAWGYGRDRRDWRHGGRRGWRRDDTKSVVQCARRLLRAIAAAVRYRLREPREWPGRSNLPADPGRSPGPGALSALSTLSRGRDAFDLDPRTQRQRFGRQRGACWWVRGPERGRVGFVHGREICHVGEEHGALDDIVELSTARAQDRPHVLE